LEVLNFYNNVPGVFDAEIFEELVTRPGLKIERIISSGQSTPPGEWYDQEKEEWVILLTGSACLTFEGDDTDYNLLPGDYILIPAHKRHRVKRTDPVNKTIWLALHF